MGYRIGLLVTICIMLIFSCKPSEKGKAKKRDATFYQNPVHNLDFPILPLFAPMTVPIMLTLRRRLFRTILLISR